MANQDDNSNTAVVQEVPRGPNGIVGESTPSLTMKQRWHEATHVLEDVGDRNNPRKQEWVRKAGAPSLRQFARKLLLENDELATTWFANKRGANNQKRTDANIARADTERAATRASRHKRESKN
jgi:hypothetical protein